jgi:hypothetical protein
LVKLRLAPELQRDIMTHQSNNISKMN